ncbi:E1A-binding protein p400 isoform X2 [Protopterus annectens]|uniref:E1A-binding protein p400 isoform X2 n=1 Tax=Protopterus annectens TaxID=7888 RepID=UPI001CFB6D5A|nr:E1A-binding protein p400 isoform X2 [Protopterus annectens]
MMHHGSGSQNVQRQLQRSKSLTGSEGEEQQGNLPQSPAASFAPAASPSAPQSPGYQIQQLLMSRSPVAGQNVNIALQNVGQVVTGNQQITLASLPVPSPASPNFQCTSQQRRFDHGSPSYIQVTSPVPQQVQPQSPTQHSPVSMQALQNARSSTPATIGLSMCQSPTRAVVDVNALRQINLSPSNSGHFVYQELSGLQIAQGASGQVQLTSPTTSTSVQRERRLSQPHSQTGGTIHHLGPQSPVASGASLQPLTSPGHITTTNLPPQISTIIQGQLIQQQQQQQQQGLHGQHITRPLGYDRTSTGMIAGVGGSSGFGITSPPPPTSPSRAAVAQGLSSITFTTSGLGVVKKQPKKLEEIPPATAEIAQMRKQCIEHHTKEMELLRENRKEFLIELFFLQQLQGNMMDFLAFKKKLCVQLQFYLRQNDLDMDEDEEEEQSEVINDEVKVVTGKDGQTGTPVAIATQLPPNVSAAFSSQQQPFQQTHTSTSVAATASTIEIEAFKRQQVVNQTAADQVKRQRIEVGRHGIVFQHPGVVSGVPLQQLMPTAQGGMPPTPQTVQLTGQKQSQQQYDPSKGPPVQNAASLHTPPPQLPVRLPPNSVAMTSLSATLQLAQQQQQLQQLPPAPPLPVPQQIVEPQSQPQLQVQPPFQIQVKPQIPPVPAPTAVQTPLQTQLQQQMQPMGQIQLQGQMPLQLPQPPSQLQQQPQQQTVQLVRPAAESVQVCQRLVANPIPPPPLPSTGVSVTVSPAVYTSVPTRTSPASIKNHSPGSSKPPQLAVTAAPKASIPAQNSAPQQQDSTQDKLAEQVKLENQVHQRISELRKEGLWSLRRLPKVQEPPRPKSQWDYVLEEMQWMAADFAQERRWKMGIAKKLVRTVARFHEEKKIIEEKTVKEKQNSLRRIAASVAREVEYFWSNIEQVVEIKLQIQIQEKRRRALTLNKNLKKEPDAKAKGLCSSVLTETDSGFQTSTKRKASENDLEEEVEDEEETIEEQEDLEKSTDIEMELAELAKDAEIPLDVLAEHYAGAYAEDFQWPQPNSDNEEDDQGMDEFQPETEGPQEEVVIDSLLTIDPSKGPERLSAGTFDGKKTRKNIVDVASMAEQFLPKGIAKATASPQAKLCHPRLLHGTLREYQQIGVDWLLKLYKKNLNGILADEAGLGKTVQIISFLAGLAASEGNWGPHLVVVRACKLLTWELQFKRWCPGLKIHLYIGNRRERRVKRQMWLEPNSFHVCITSYKLLLRDHKAFSKKRWQYMILDEVQQLKSMTETHWETILGFRSLRRLLLLDSPLQNTLFELWTMVHFLLPGISRPYLDFPVKSGSEENQDYCHKLVIRLHRMIQPFLLRRSKRDVEKQLPKKYEHVLKCRLSARQKVLYEDIMSQPGTQEALKNGHFINVLHVLMQLQKICNHPDLTNPRPSHYSYVLAALQYTTASLILKALEYEPWKNTSISAFDLIGSETKMSRYEAQVLPKQKVTRKLIEEIYNSPDPPSRPTAAKLKPSKLFQPVLYGQKPEGKTVVFTSTQPQRTTATTTTTVAQQGQAWGKSPVTSVPSGQGGEVVKIAQLATIAGSQGRIAQPEGPVTLQFQGNRFTLSKSQLRQLTAGQPLQLQGSVLQIVQAPSQQILRPQGPVVMQNVPQTGNLQTSITALGTQQSTAMLNSTTVTPSAVTSQPRVPTPTADQATLPKPAQPGGDAAQESNEEKCRLLKERLDSIFAMNERRCCRSPVYGMDLVEICSSISRRKIPMRAIKSSWKWAGFVNCRAAQEPEEVVSIQCETLGRMILSLAQREEALQHTVKSVSCVVPAALASLPCLQVPNPPAVYTHSMRLLWQNMKMGLAPFLQHKWPFIFPSSLQFPELRLVQYDSGKLEALAVLLHKLKSEGRRVLIFSQMVRMLDIMELFLNFHGFTYVRIDESACREERQEQLKDFNRDRRIFCAVLSIHGGSVGLKLVEADTFVFYDNDLNPVMDAKAQEWCDKIGKSKDIHIYRLVSGNSIEEKLLKNGTKDLIREVAAQGNDYSMAFLTQQTIQELFEVHSPNEDSGFRVKAEEFVVLSQEPSPYENISAKVAKPFIEALNSIEGEEAGHHKRLKNIEMGLTSRVVTDEMSPAADEEGLSEFEELEAVVEQLTPIEKYALKYLEVSHVSSKEEVSRVVEEQLKAKKLWESNQLKLVKEEEDAHMFWDEEDVLFTYTREDAYCKEYVCEGPDGQTEIMPIWTPPTPPQDDNDIYIDSVMCLMYDTTPIVESKLPPVYIRKEHKRLKMDPSAIGRKKKQRHGEAVIPPRSLFDRATPGMLKMRKEGKDQKKNMLLKQQSQFSKPLPTIVKTTVEAGQDNPEWLISEDWALLQAVKQLLELPLNLSIISPAHTPNWDLVSDVVNVCSRIYRSPKQCRNRYESVIIPREEGRLIYESNPKKKAQSIYKTKNNRPLRTSQIYAQDECATHTQLYTTRFELMKMIASKRSPPIKPLLGMNPFQKNPKNASVLAESGISYDKPLPPNQVASLRAERIAKEKKALAEQQRAQQQQQQQTGQPQAPQTVTPQLQAPPPQPAQAQVVQQSQAVVQTAATTVASTAVLTGTLKTAVSGASLQTAAVSGNVIVTGVPATTFQPINKRLASPVQPASLTTTGSSAAQVVHTQQRTVTAPAAPAEMVAIATSQAARALTPVTASPAVTTTLTPVQSQARTLVTQGSPATASSVQLSKTLTPAHIHLIRQQSAQMQVQQTQVPPSSQLKTVSKVPPLLKLQKQKLMQVQQQQTQQVSPQQTTQVQQQQQPTQQQSQQLTAVTAPRSGAVLAGNTVTSLQVARLTRVPGGIQSQGQIQTQNPQTSQVTLTKPNMVSLPAAVVPSSGVTTLPVTVAGISVAISQPQKAAGGQTVVTPQLQVQQLLKIKQPQPKTVTSQVAAGQTVQQKMASQQVTIQTQQAAQQQKVTYATQSGLKTGFLTTPLPQAQKPSGTQQVQTQIQLTKLSQMVPQQPTVTNIQQMVPAPQQVQAQPQTVTLSQATSSGQQQVQVIPTAAQVVQQKLIQQQVASAPAQIQTSLSQNPAQAPATSDAQVQQTKVQMRTAPAVRLKAPNKPS